MRQARRKAVRSGVLSARPDETVNREFGAYDAIRDNFPKYVVSLDEFDMSRNGIMTLYIVFLQTVKKVESYEQINIQSIILSEA